MRSIVAEPINAEAFAPFGELLVPPDHADRVYFDSTLSNLRPGAKPSLSIAYVEPTASLPLNATQMERHAFSSQSFVPLDAGRFFVIVAPHGADGLPDMAKVRAFTVEGGLGVTFRADVWHHPMTVFGAPARFAVMMWLDGSDQDTELVTLDAPFQVEIKLK